MNAALEDVDQLIAGRPNFRLAHLVRGDLLMARAGPISGFGNTGHAARERLDELRAEVSTRLRAYNDHLPQNLVPRYLLQFAPTQQHAIVVDASRSRVYVYENADGMGIAAWQTHKKRVNAAKTWIKVSLTNMSVFRNPGKQSLIVVTFNQDFRSNNLSQKTRKRQYWITEEGRWKIAYEAPIHRAVLAMPESFPVKTR